MKLPATILAGTILGVMAGCGTSGSDDEPLTVGAASSLRTALADYAGQDDSLDPVRVSFAGSDLIAAQIRPGAGIDGIAAASTSDPDELFKDGLVGKPVPYARNEVVIGVPAGSGIDSELFQEAAGQLFPTTLDILGRVQIFVPKEQASEARKQLDEYLNATE